LDDLRNEGLITINQLGSRGHADDEITIVHWFKYPQIIATMPQWQMTHLYKCVICHWGAHTALVYAASTHYNLSLTDLPTPTNLVLCYK
jgi:hypothetical protein